MWPETPAFAKRKDQIGLEILVFTYTFSYGIGVVSMRKRKTEQFFNFVIDVKFGQSLKYPDRSWKQE